MPKSRKEKVCIICGLSMPATSDYYYKQVGKDGKYRLRSSCKECCKAYRQTNEKKYYMDHREEIKARVKKNYYKNKHSKGETV